MLEPFDLPSGDVRWKQVSEPTCATPSQSLDLDEGRCTDAENRSFEMTVTPGIYSFSANAEVLVVSRNLASDELASALGTAAVASGWLSLCHVSEMKTIRGPQARLPFLCHLRTTFASMVSASCNFISLVLDHVPTEMLSVSEKQYTFIGALDLRVNVSNSRHSCGISYFVTSLGSGELWGLKSATPVCSE